MLRGLLDNLISRVIGAFVRFFTILAGIIVLAFQALYELIIVVCWLILPAFPVIGLILMVVGWVPQWT